jgi:hypothetical protein
MTHEEEMALRELAAKPHYISSVQELLGPLSLWSAQGMQDHVRKAVEAEREACAKLCEDMDSMSDYYGLRIELVCAEAIRKRGNT